MGIINHHAVRLIERDHLAWPPEFHEIVGQDAWDQHIAREIQYAARHPNV